MKWIKGISYSVQGPDCHSNMLCFCGCRPVHACPAPRLLRGRRGAWAGTDIEQSQRWAPQSRKATTAHPVEPSSRCCRCETICTAHMLTECNAPCDLLLHRPDTLLGNSSRQQSWLRLQHVQPPPNNTAHSPHKSGHMFAAPVHGASPLLNVWQARQPGALLIAAGSTAQHTARPLAPATLMHAASSAAERCSLVRHGRHHHHATVTLGLKKPLTHTDIEHEHAAPT